MSRFSKGWIPSDKPARFAFAAHPAATAMSTPLSVNMIAHCPAVMDQGSGNFGTSSCTGHANSGACYTSFSAAGRPLAFVPSPKALYANGRAITRAASGLDPDTNKLTDDGAMPSDVVLGMERWGVEPIKAPTSDGRYSDCEPANINDEPQILDLEEAAKTLVIQEHGITSTGRQRVLEIRQALAAGFAVAIGVQVDDAFENYGASSPPIGAPAPSNLLGRHDLFLYGYRTEPDGSTVALGQNSWGANTGWGKAGRFEATEAWLTDFDAGDIWAIVPVTTEAV